MSREPTRDRHAHLQLVQQIEAPELIGANERWLTRTGSGLYIGSAYTRPAPQPSDDAEQIQRALLTPSRRRRDNKPSPRGNGRIRSCMLACAIGLAIAVVLFFHLSS